MKKRLNAVLQVLAAVAWRLFGLLLFVLGGAAATGSILTGSWINGVLIAWGTLAIGVVGAIGYAIVTTGRVTPQDIHRAARDAAEKAREDQEAKRK